VAVVAQASLLKRVIEAIKENSGFGEINMECDEKGMQTQALGTMAIVFTLFFEAFLLLFCLDSSDLMPRQFERLRFPHRTALCWFRVLLLQ
jgi:hypothetical protein